MNNPQEQFCHPDEGDGNHKSVIDKDGGQCTYDYDTAGRIIRVIRPAGSRTMFKYDVAGQRVET